MMVQRVGNSVAGGQSLKAETYQVRAGDNFTSIAKQHGMSIKALEKLNPQIRDINRLAVGQELNVPALGEHTVKRGESLERIAKRYGVANLDALLQLNPQIRDPNSIQIGQKIRLPAQAQGTRSALKEPRSATITSISNAKSGSPQEIFIRKVSLAAMESMEKTGTPASVTIAQSILESGWGESDLSQKYHNYFGIKGRGPAGAVDMRTNEVYSGRTVRINAHFRAYNNMAEGFSDHGSMLARMGRYSDAYAQCRDCDLTPKERANAFAQGLQDAGYATDPKYAKKLIYLMKRYNLYQYDQFSPTRPNS